MSTISFQNDGEMDIVAATTFGVSAKVGDNPIGYFGTGFKYAVAIVLRLGGKLTLYIGEKRYTFTLEKLEVRGQEFQRIKMNNSPRDWTTRMGINWQPWQAFRELYCNAKDEGGFVTNRKLKPEAGKTTVIVENLASFSEAFDKRSAFFLETKPIYVGAFFEIHPGKSNGIYYRGILVGQFEQDSPVTYNITSPMELTEDRTVKYPWTPREYITRGLLTFHGKPELLEEILTAGRESAEARLNFDGSVEPNEVFLEKVGEIRRGPKAGLLSDSARAVHDRYAVKRGGDPEAVTLSPDHQAMLDEGLKLIDLMGFFPRRDKVAVIPVASLGSGVLGLAHKGKVYISQRAFGYGQDTVTGTLFEEFSHVTMDMRDETRDFQNFLINCIAQLGRRGCKPTF